MSKSLTKAFFVTFFITICLLLQTSLQADGWGKTEQVIEFEGTTWNGIYFDLNGLNLTASIPNYSGASLQNGTVSMTGSVGDAGFAILTSMNSGFKPPKTIQEFVKLVQDANPEFVVSAIDPKKFGVKYAVDLAPVNQDETVFWRFLSTKDRLIQLGTADANANRRVYFFDSVFVK
jgi:hypothetical protein